MTHLDLFSGIGGFHLAAEWAGFKTVGFSEIESYCCKLLNEKWPEIKNYGDIRTADFSELRGAVTVLSAGVPCQPASLAGKRRGAKDDRWLWPATLDVVGLVEPAWCVFENPSGIVSLDEFRGVLLRLAGLGYETRLFSVPANAVGAKHRRERVFVVAHAGRHHSERRCGQWRGQAEAGARNGAARPGEHAETLADADSAERRPSQPGGNEHHGQETEWRQSANRFAGVCDSLAADADNTRLQGRDSGELRECAGQRVAEASSASFVADTTSPRCSQGESGESESVRNGARGAEPERRDGRFEFRLTQSGIRLSTDGISDRLDATQRDASQSDSAIGQDLFSLRQTVQPDEVQRDFGGQYSVSGAEILQPEMYGRSEAEGLSDPQSLPQTGSASAQDGMSRVWCHCETIDPSLGSGLEQQRSGESANPMLSMPSLTASPLVQGRTIRNRSAQLKALGNAVVPQQAYPFFEAIAQVTAG